jgi:hypothetical protein
MPRCAPNVESIDSRQAKEHARDEAIAVPRLGPEVRPGGLRRRSGIAGTQPASRNSRPIASALLEQSNIVTFAKRFCHFDRNRRPFRLQSGHNSLIAAVSGPQNCHLSANRGVRACGRRITNQAAVGVSNSPLQCRSQA